MRAPTLGLLVALAGCASTPSSAAPSTGAQPERAATASTSSETKAATSPARDTAAASGGVEEASRAREETEAGRAPSDATASAAEPGTAEEIVQAKDESDPFEAWLRELRAEALEAGVDEPILEQALAGVAPHPRVIALDRKQPEGTMTFQQYLDRVLPRSRIQTARKLYDKHQDILQEVGRRYDVPPRYIVALWGMETSFGSNTGGFNVIQSLATLAWEGRRSAFFRRELLNALRILDQGDITPEAMSGSWAGAMGQCQFMPSSYLSWAVDHDGDGRRDIWSTLPDVFASAANYLKQNGWNGGQTWGREVRLPGDFDRSLIDRRVERSLSEWSELGVRRADGRRLPRVDMEGALVQPGGPDGPTYLVYGNYRTLLHWNRSLYFATAVGLFADAIVAR